MSESYVVSPGDDTLALDHNSLRIDVLDTSLGHTHNGVDSKISDVVCATQTRTYVVNPADLVPEKNDSSWKIDNLYFISGSDTVYCSARAGLHLPHGAIITSVKVDWYRDDAAATGEAVLHRYLDEMARCDSNSHAGNHSVEDTTIDHATIDNNYSYTFYVRVDPNDFKGDVRFYRAVITYTIAKTLP